ncbi:MAG: ATP-binding protein [Bacteroidota bacterium]
MIGRKEEQKKIKRLLQSERSEFLAVTGRRRVGKTFLIDESLRPYYCFNMTGIQNGNLRSQIVNFNIKLSEYDGSFTPQSADNWQMAFLQLKAYLKTLDNAKKQVIFIDELPWVYTPRSGFVQMLAHFWNDYLSKEKHFLLVICGSATSWITQKIINDQGGLHNRVTEIIHLSPFSLSETYDFIRAKSIRLSIQEITRIYMSLGGIPFYLENLRKGESFAAFIERTCFDPRGILRNEYHNLYQALFHNSEIHQSIVATLAKHPQGLERSKLLKANNTTATGTYQRAIQELIVSDFVVETLPFGKKKRGSLYRLSDEYSTFYHRFIRDHQKYTPGLWQQLAASQAYKIWAGYAFEMLCYKHITAIKKALGIAAVYTEISTLRVASHEDQAGFQIDLIIDRQDHSINLCEIKFHAAPFTISKKYYHTLIAKKQRFLEYTQTKKQVFLTFITNHGLMENEYAQEIVDAEVRLEEIIK